MLRGVDGENPELEAIRAMQYEGSRFEIAQGFRETGNELAREKKWNDAREFYGKAVATVLGDDKWEKPEDPVEAAKQEQETLEASYVNRALCQLELSMYLLPDAINDDTNSVGKKTTDQQPSTAPRP